MIPPIQLIDSCSMTLYMDKEIQKLKTAVKSYLYSLLEQGFSENELRWNLVFDKLQVEHSYFSQNEIDGILTKEALIELFNEVKTDFLINKVHEVESGPYGPK